MQARSEAPKGSRQGVRVERLGRYLAAEIHGVDLAERISDQNFADIRSALVEHELIVMRAQDITAADQLRFGRMFGEASVHPFSPNLSDMPELIVLENHADNPPRLTDVWHSDETFRAAPPMATILRSVICPEIGGDTLFASMSAAFEGLNDRQQQFLSNLQAVHDFKPFRALLPSDEDGHRRLREMETRFPRQTHPVVRLHPESGRKVIFVNPQFTIGIDGMAERESRPLLDMLFDLAKIPEYQFRLNWEPGTVAIWDNRAVQHYAVHDYWPQRRRMERITIAGDAPFGVQDGRNVPLVPRRPVEAVRPAGQDGAPVRQVDRT